MKQGLAVWMVCGALLGPSAFAQGQMQGGQGRAVVTVLPRHHNELAPNFTVQDLTVKVNGKESTVTGWVPLHGVEDKLELVLLIDGAARNLNGAQFDEIQQFIQGLTPNTKVAIGYMGNGHVTLAGPLSADHAQVVRGLHLPGGIGGSSGGPYFSLSDIAKNWPSAARGVRREVVLVTDGVDPFTPHYDPSDVYVQGAINDAVRAGLVVYSIFWTNRNNSNGVSDEAVGGQSYLADLTRSTGGYSYQSGTSNPVSFASFLKDLSLRLDNQYELTFTARLDRKPAVETLKLKIDGPAAEVDAPELVWVDRP
jgi:hypothetical protein